LRQIDRAQLEGVKKILVIQLGPFGDGLLTTSYFETIKKRLPQAKLWYVIKEEYAAAVREHPFIDGLIIIKRGKRLRYVLERLRTIGRIRREKFDLVIDQQNMPSSQHLTLLSGARFRVGYADGRLGFAYNYKAGRGKLRYSASRKYDILGPLGIAEEPYRLYFTIDQGARAYVDRWLREESLDPKNLVCLSPGSPVVKKRWNLANYARLGDLVQTETPYRVMLLWARAERRDVDAVLSMMKTTPVMAPPTDLGQAAALLERVRLLVCNDGGLNHLAVATETPTLAIFGATDPTVWSAASVFPHHHHLHNPTSRPGDDTFGISAEEALEEVRQMLAANGRTRVGRQIGRQP
jgi:ADP-heptose:LPS heptosyltransferase